MTETMKELKMQEIQERAQKIEQFRQTATQDLQRQQEQRVPALSGFIFQQ